MPVHRLPNGMRVCVDPVPGAEVSAVYVWINVGSADEEPGMEGAAHVVEHMVFKGTSRHGPGEVAAEVEGQGGDLNAWTSFDETVFHATVPAGGTVAAMEVLAEMVCRPRLDPAELETERQVILEEIRGGQDDPDLVLGEAVYAHAWGPHPYGRPIIGFVDSVKRMSRAALHAFWSRWYLPANACLAVAGPLGAPEILAAAEACFGADRRPAPPARARPARSPGGGRHRLRRRFSANLAEVAFPAPGHGHPELPALDTLAQLVGGGASSPLEREVRRGVAGCVSADMGLEAERFGSLLVLGVQAVPGALGDSLAAAGALLERVREGWIDEADLARAKAQIVADRVFRKESVDGRAHQACFHQEVYGDLEAGVRYDAAVRALDPAALRRVAATWLRPEAAVEVRLSAERKAPRAPPALPPGPARPAVIRARLDNGLRVLIEPGENAVVGLRVAGLGGQLHDRPASAGSSAAWGRVVARGAGGADAVAIARLTEGLGGHFGAIVGRSSMGLRLDLAAEALGDGLELILDALLDPAFAADEVEMARVELAEMVREREDHPDLLLADAVWARACPGHPWGLPALGTEASLGRLSPAALRRLHGRWARGGNLVLAASGPMDPERLLRRLRPLGRLPAAAVPPWPRPPRFRPGSVRRRVQGEQAHLALAFPALGVAHPDAPALDLLSAVLGGQGGRLFVELREAHGLAYGVSCSVQDGVHPGLLLCALATEGARATEGMRRLEESLARVAAGELEAAEVDRARAWVLGAAAMERQGAGQRASEAAWAELYGFDGAEYRALVRRVAAVDLPTVRRVAKAVLSQAPVRALLRPGAR